MVSLCVWLLWFVFLGLVSLFATLLSILALFFLLFLLIHLVPLLVEVFFSSPHGSTCLLSQEVSNSILVVSNFGWGNSL